MTDIWWAAGNAAALRTNYAENAGKRSAMAPHGPRYELGMLARGRLRVVFGRFWCSFHGKAAPFPGPLPKSPVEQGTETARNDRFSPHRALARRIGGYGSAFYGPFAKPSFAFSRTPRQPSDRPSPFGGFASPLVMLS